MTQSDADRERELLESLQERAKELNCLYRVDEILSADSARDVVFHDLIDALPAGWQYPDICRARIRIRDVVYKPDDLVESPWSLSAEIRVEGEAAGEVTVFYSERRARTDDGPFLKEERRLINTIADRIGLYLLQYRLRRAHDTLERDLRSLKTHEKAAWVILLDFLGRTDAELVRRLTRKMINYLSWNGVADAQKLLRVVMPAGVPENEREEEDANRPAERQAVPEASKATAAAFDLAAGHLAEGDIITLVQTWIREEKSSFLIRILEAPDTTLADIVDAVERYENTSIEENDLPIAARTTLRVSLLRRFFTDRLEYINVAKSHIAVGDFYDLVRRLIYPARSQGKLGGKGAGIFLAARILDKHVGAGGKSLSVRIPKTWYVASDGVLEFMRHNNLDDLYNQKYMEIERIRQDYPHVVQLFKNSEFPPEMINGLAAALDDFEDRPLIVRSSSLLEDRAGSAFSGKYKSLFLANQGTKRQRLADLMDAIAEVYASIFGPDPIEYRAERGLLDFREEMGVLIQEVVGQRVGRYFLPAFSGVGFKNNEFRWSPRVRRSDGLLRLVPGLGTRAVDRLSDDYPILVSPGQPGLRVNVDASEILRYSPRMIDVIDLEANAFSTISLEALLRDSGDEYGLARTLVSIVEGDQVRPPAGLEPDWTKDKFVMDFQGLTSRSPFPARMKEILDVLSEELGTPVDIEFAHDGEDLYLLQCRAQSYAPERAPAPIPRDIPRNRHIFSAHRYISNGRVGDVTHVVYVDPENYASLESRRDLLDVARAVGRLNSILPKRQFILMGPGRWGSRGDIRLGVGVTYSDINNTAVLLEIAMQKGNYTPELSFGTHFFQDLVEADIRYVPLYPSEEGNILNMPFLTRTRSVFSDLVPEYARFADVIRVIDVPQETGGQVLSILMNADLGEAVGILAPPSKQAEEYEFNQPVRDAYAEDHWRWRLQMAERLAGELDGEALGVKACYVLGSTKNATAGPASDLDLLIHFTGDEAQRTALSAWLSGWSQALAEVNYLRTGYRSDGLLDVHFVTDLDITNQTSFAVKIGAVTDAARPLTMKGIAPG